MPNGDFNRFLGTVTAPRSAEGSLTIEAKLLPATNTRPARVKAKVLGGTAELTLPRSGYRSVNAELRETARKLAVALDRDPNLVQVSPTANGYLYRTYAYGQKEES